MPGVFVNIHGGDDFLGRAEEFNVFFANAGKHTYEQSQVNLKLHATEATDE